jgi:hypothetical protein
MGDINTCNQYNTVIEELKIKNKISSFDQAFKKEEDLISFETTFQECDLQEGQTAVDNGCNKP